MGGYTDKGNKASAKAIGTTGLIFMEPPLCVPSCKAHSSERSPDRSSRRWLEVQVEPGTERHLPLRRAKVRPEDLTDEAPPERWGQGPLQTIYDDWAGKRRPQAKPGFGLPELYALLGELAGRVVPRSEQFVPSATWSRM